MNQTDKTPLWLDLRKEYIDDNFSKLQVYLKNCSGSGARDAFYETTIELLRSRVEDLIGNISVRPIYSDEEDRKTMIFHASLLASYLLADGDSPLALPAYIAFMGELRLLNPRMSSAIIDAAVKRLRHEKVTMLGFGWADLEKIGTDLFAYNASALATFDVPRKKSLVLSKSGTAFVSAEGLYLTHEPLVDARKLVKSGAKSLDTGVNIALCTKSSEKLKQSMENSLPDMDEYTNEFIRLQYQVENVRPAVTLKSYFENDDVVVRITHIDTDGTMHVETVDQAYVRLEGVIRFEKPSLVYYYTNSLYVYFKVGDYLKATITDIANPTFNIERQLVNFFVEDTQNTEAEGSEFVAKLIDEKPGYYGWVNSYGIAMFTPNTGEFVRGDFAYLSVEKYQQGKYYGKIDALIEGEASIDDHFDEKTVRHDCIRAFAEETEPPVSSKPEEEMVELSPVIIRLLLRQLFDHQKSLLKPSDRFRFLANASVMAELVGDDLSASYIRFSRTYLRALVQFVCNEDMRNIHLTPDEEYKDANSTMIRLEVIGLLKEYGRKDNSEKLADTIQRFESEQPMLARLARLIQTANSMQDTLSKSSLNVIRREIIKTLSIETENDADLEADGGTYLGIESGTQEFKTSIIYPSNNHMQPDEYAQNQNVLKGICAFLNSTTGGVLYLGVSDQGYVTGLDNDMKYLHHQTIDAYMRYVQDTAKKHFGIDTLPYLRIEPLYDNKVVAIYVEPHPYRVVELNNTAYLRVNAESREMPEEVRRQLIARKVFTDKDRAAAISLLQHACTQKKCVRLHNYASSSSGIVADRLVEAYDVRPEDGLVMCFDRTKSVAAVFKINRIGYVEILEDEPWKYTASHKKIEVDVFHMSGDVPVHVSLQLDLMAKNLLLEEYPMAKNCVEPDKRDGNVWYFDADVYQMEGIARFYLGLAGHIKIVEAPGLKTYVADYVKRHLQL